LPQSVLGSFPVRYIRVQFQESEWLAIFARPRGPAASRDDRASIPPLLDKLTLPASFPEELRLDVLERFGKFRAQDVLRVFSQNFFFGPAIEAGRAAVPVSDPVIQTANQNGVVGQIQQFSLSAALRRSAFQFCCAFPDTCFQLIVRLAEQFLHTRLFGDI